MPYALALDRDYAKIRQRKFGKGIGSVYYGLGSSDPEPMPLPNFLCRILRILTPGTAPGPVNRCAGGVYYVKFQGLQLSYSLASVYLQN